MTSKHTIARMWPPLPGDCCQHFHPSYHHPQPRSPSSSQNGPSALPHAPTCNAVCPQHGSQGDTLSHIRSLLHHSSAQDLPVAPRACMCAKSLQSCLTLCDPMDCRPPLFMGFPGKNTGVGCCALLQEIFLTQRSSQSLLRLRHRQVGSLPLALPGKPDSSLHSK